jgi:hypothetical protein
VGSTNKLRGEKLIKLLSVPQEKGGTHGRRKKQLPATETKIKICKSLPRDEKIQRYFNMPGENTKRTGAPKQNVDYVKGEQKEPKILWA